MSVADTSKMVYFKNENECFNLRCASVCVRKDEVLLFYFDKEKGDFWTLQGGRCNMYETTSDAIIREFKEEIGEKISIIRLLWVIENFFEFKGTNFHELLFVYLAELNTDSEVIKTDEFFAHEGERSMLCRWVKIKDLGKYKILPNIFYSLLSNIPNETQHIVHHDKNITI